ncbi:atrial natriuretic peptide receptor 1-like [Haliotis asinina]|uniref:atrial natriuretic peptide receptor 1-like n=1 Tax=Haliotis asinina TaxID=109174 RepID=UPI00353199F6
MGRSGAAVDMGLEYIRKKYNDTLDIKFTPGYAVSGPTEAGAAAAELYYKHNVDAFIGPGSSTSVEAMGHLVTQWNLPFITPAGGSGTLADKILYPTLTRMSPISVESYSYFILKMIDKYSWNHFVIFHSGSVSRLHWYSMDDILKANNDYSWSHYEIDQETFTTADYERILIDASKYARVFILYTNAPETREILLVAHRLGYSKGEYVMLVTKGLDRSIDESYWRYGDDNDEAAKNAYQSCLFFTGEAVSSAFAAFEQEVKERALRDYGFDYVGTNTSVHFLTASYYDSFVMFGQVLNETVAEGGDPRDGRAFAERLWNRTYPGVTGAYTINSEGARDSEVYMHDLDPATGAFKLVGRYIRAKDSLIIVDEIHWPGGGPPLDIPKCGFRNDRCLSSGKLGTVR